MLCEYCHNYTNTKLKSSKKILVNIRKKFKISDFVNHICDSCFNKFKEAEKIYISTLFK